MNNTPSNFDENYKAVIYDKLLVIHLQAGVAQLVEHQPSKLRVAGSSLVACSVMNYRGTANVAQG